MQVTWVPVCPEVELGLGVPREPIGLIRPAAGALLRLLAFDSKRDLTAAMNELVLARADELAARGIAGYIFKARSPSCGIADVPIFAGTDQGASSPVVDKGRGVFAEAVIARLPELPVASDEDLAEPEARAAFVRRVECYHRSRMGP